MAPKRGTRKLRGGSSSNSNVKRNAEAAERGVKPPEAKKTIRNKAEAMAYRRWDYQRILKREDDINASIKHAKDDLKDIEKKKERIINEEFIKEASAWEKQMTKKRGWFY